MIDHFTLSVSDLYRSKEFYQQALAPLGYSIVADYGQLVGFGREGKPYFWLKQSAQPTTPMHIAFKAIDRPAVDAFHQAALEAGARDDGAPGPRTLYHPHYYGAFVIEPDGHPIEAVCHTPARKKKSARKAAPKKTKRAKKR